MYSHKSIDPESVPGVCSSIRCTTFDLPPTSVHLQTIVHNLNREWALYLRFELSFGPRGRAFLEADLSDVKVHPAVTQARLGKYLTPQSCSGRINGVSLFPSYRCRPPRAHGFVCHCHPLTPFVELSPFHITQGVIRQV